MQRFSLIISLFAFAACNTANKHTPTANGHQDTPKTITAIPDTAITASTNTYDTYCNARFGFCIDYPPSLLTEEHESQNGDGTDFSNSKNEFILTVWGRWDEDENGNKLSLPAQYAADVADRQSSGDSISYKKLGKTFYVISGNRKDGKIFYQKTITKTDAFAFAVLEYTPDEKPMYDSLAGLVLRTLK